MDGEEAGPTQLLSMMEVLAQSWVHFCSSESLVDPWCHLKAKPCISWNGNKGQSLGIESLGKSYPGLRTWNPPLPFQASWNSLAPEYLWSLSPRD